MFLKYILIVMFTEIRHRKSKELFLFFVRMGTIIIGETMSKKIAYGLMTLSFVLIISGGVSSFLLGLQADRNLTFQRIDMVHDEFEIFSTNTSMFELEREELYTTVLGDLYYDTMFDEDKSVKEKLSNYEHLTDELTKNVKKLNI